MSGLSQLTALFYASGNGDTFLHNVRRGLDRLRAEVVGNGLFPRCLLHSQYQPAPVRLVLSSPTSAAMDAVA